MEPPLYARIHDEIERNILSGAWPPGHRLPSELALAGHYGCSRMTVNKALSRLAGEGYIARRRRAGSVVTRPHALSAVLELHLVRTEVESLGLDYGYRLLARHERQATAAERRHFDADGQLAVLDVTALHQAGRRPFCLEQRLVSLAEAPEAATVSFAQRAPGEWLQDVVPWNLAEHEISARGADATVAAALAVPEGSPCLVIERRTWKGKGVVTWVRLTYAGESHSLVARFTPPG